MKTKLLKVLMPLAVSASAITPLCMTSCGEDNSEITIDTKEIKSGDSYTTYKFKLPSVPTDKKVSVEINNKTADQEQVILDPDYVLTNGSNYASELAVSDDGTVEVPVCYAYAPTASSTSTFGVTFKYDNETVTKTVDDLKFDYSVDYDVDLKDGTYDPETQSKVTPAEETHWTTGSNVADIYMSDIEKTPIIFQSDARYSTSKNIKDAVENEDFVNLKSFRAYFNNLYKDEMGLNVQMNYEVKGEETGSKFEFIQQGQGEEGRGQRKFVFNNFDLSCNFMTANGYTFEWNTLNKFFTLKDSTKKYDLIGRMNGKFDATVYSREDETKEFTEVQPKKSINYNGLITLDESSNEEKYSDQFLAFMFAFGIIHLTYNFGWGVQPEDIVLTILSNYAKNCKI